MDNENEINNEELKKSEEKILKSYDKIFDYINSELKNDEENLAKNKIEYNTNEILIEKIIANTVTMFSSSEMIKYIKSLKTKFDEESLSAIINMVAFASSAAAHQAIVFYDEVLHQNLDLMVEKLKMKMAENQVTIESLESVMNIFKVRLDEVRNKIQVDEITK